MNKLHSILMLAVLITTLTLINHSIHWTVIWISIILISFLLLSIGISWFLAKTGVFVNDIGQFIALLLTMLLFLSSVFYPAFALPESLRDYLFLNPLNPSSFIFEQLRVVTLYSQSPDWSVLAIYTLITPPFAQFSFCWFEKTRKGFNDAL